MSFVEKDLNGNEAKERLPLEKLRAQAIFELQETPELTEKCLAALKVALKRDKALTYLDDDEFLVQFLRARKYKVDRAAIMVQKFFRLRANQIDLLNLIVPSEKTTFFKTGAVSILKHRDNFGRHVVLVRAFKWDLSQHCFDDFLAGAFLVLDEAIRSVDTQYNGVVLLTDCEGFGIAQFRTISVHRLRGIAGILQDSYPMRFKKIHVVNNPFLFTSVYYAIRPFLKKKMNERIHFHGKNLESLHQFLDPKYLPDHLGGELCEQEAVDYELYQKLLTRDDYYERLVNHGYLKNDKKH